MRKWGDEKNCSEKVKMISFEKIIQSSDLITSKPAPVFPLASHGVPGQRTWHKQIFLQPIFSFVSRQVYDYQFLAWGSHEIQVRMIFLLCFHSFWQPQTIFGDFWHFLSIFRHQIAVLNNEAFMYHLLVRIYSQIAVNKEWNILYSKSIPTAKKHKKETLKKETEWKYNNNTDM